MIAEPLRKTDAYCSTSSADSKPVRSGPLMELRSYPQWTQDMVASCAEAKQKLLDHDIWRLMKAALLDFRTTRNFLVGAWPVVDQFPHYMALNLLKTRFGRCYGEDMARRWLIRNMRIEQNHAKYWRDWAVACGIAHEDLVYGAPPPGTMSLSNWIFRVCRNESLATAMAVANYAIEGVTGEWAWSVISTQAYENSFDKNIRRKATRWLRVHAEYDDVHPWEALEIVCALMGTNPKARDVADVGRCIRKTYDIYRRSLDHCFE
ncbi:MAG: TenA family transcriptional regulator [Gammaproteobacteria bacterium]